MDLNDDTPIELEEFPVSSKEEMQLRLSLLDALTAEIDLLTEDRDAVLAHRKSGKEIDLNTSIRKICNRQIQNVLKRIVNRWTIGTKYSYDRQNLGFIEEKKKD